MGLPTYITREAFLAASETHTTTRRAAQIDRLIHSASRQIDERFHRHFFPLTETVTFKDIDATYLPSIGSGFWLGRDLLSLVAATVDGVAVSDPSAVELYPSQHGPPYSWIGLSGDEVAIEAVWGYSDDEAPAGALASTINASVTDVDVTNSAKVGIGDLLRVGTERMIVVGTQLLDTTVNLASGLTADLSDDVVSVSSGAGIHPGEKITVDSERILVLDVADNDLICRRAWDGSTLAVHSSGADVYAGRRLDVERGAVGTDADSHTSADPVLRNIAPHPIQTLCLAEAISSLHQEGSGYGRTIGSGEAVVEATGKGLADIRSEAETYRRFRMAAV